MMYNVLEARNNLSKLIADAESGIEVTIARRGVPVARIVPIDEAPSRTRNAFAEWLEKNPLTPDRVRPVNAIDAALLRARHRGLQTADALHLAVARQAGCTAFWTNDSRLETASGGLAVDIIGRG